MVWHGGMSFHGGLIGMISAMACFARRYPFTFLAIIDLLAVAAPIGLVFRPCGQFHQRRTLWPRNR